MSQAAALADMDALLHGAFAAAGLGDSATYRAGPASPELPCTVLVDKGVQLATDVVTTDQTVIRVLLAEVGEPARGAVITILDDAGAAHARWRVDRVDSSDESSAVVVVASVP
jgi:hypothetical protein